MGRNPGAAFAGMTDNPVTVQYSFEYHVDSLLEKRVMTDDELAQQLHDLKRRNETPIPLIEMFEALLSLDPTLNKKQRRKRSTEIMVAALERLERKDA
jgi:hypothetical protein